MITTYNVDRYAHSLEPANFGIAFSAIPFISENDLLNLINDFPLQTIKLIQSPSNGMQYIKEYSTGIIADASPRLKRAEVDDLLNDITKGIYAQVKNNQNKKKFMMNKFGMKHIDHNQYLSPHIIEDHYKYNSLSDKYYAWDMHCKSLCGNVLGEDPESFYFKRHLEFAFLKDVNDPYQVGSLVSTEPIHAGEMGILQIHKTDSYRKAWTAFLHAKYDSLLQGLRNSIFFAAGPTPFPDCIMCLDKFTATAEGKTTTWEELESRYGLVRDPAEMDFPHYKRSKNVYAQMGTNKFLEDKIFLPRKIKKNAWTDMNANEAIRLKLMKEPSNRHPVEWPFNVSPLLADPISPQYRFRARIRGSLTKGFEIVSIYTGNPSISRPGLIEFLYIYLDAEEEKSMTTNLHDIILKNWARSIIAKDMRKKSYKKDVTDSESSIGDSLLSDQYRSSGSRSTYTAEEDRTYESSSRDFSTLQKPSTSKIHYLDLEYIGQFFTACWHAVNKNYVESENQIAFVIKPTSAHMKRYDGASEVKLIDPSSSLAVSFLGRKGAGIARLDDEMERLLPHQYKVIIRVLFEKLHIRMPLWLDRNTCRLDGRGMDVTIKDYVNSGSISLYTSSAADDFHKQSLTLTGLPLQNGVGKYLTKCYGRILPTGTITRLKNDVPYKWECVDFKNQGYALIERGPIESSP